MERAVTHLSCISGDEFFGVLTEGLEHISNSVNRLSAAITALDSETHDQARKTLQVVVNEEAAKALLFLDVVRCPRTMSSERSKLLRYFYDHVAKGIYVEICEWQNVLTFRELSEHVEREREPYYLDGPLGVDWIFPNDIVFRREGGLYVDYVQESGEEGSYLWIHPADLSPGISSSFR